ncbi:hypothetical protein SPB21_05645 [Leptothoe sp. ISB3NOV94-8A]
MIILLVGRDHITVLSVPALALVETKNDRINAGVGQCMAEIMAADLFNRQEENNLATIFGYVTTGDLQIGFVSTRSNVVKDVVPIGKVMLHSVVKLKIIN